MKRAKLVPMDPFDGCSAAINGDMLEGNVAFVERGFVFFYISLYLIPLLYSFLFVENVRFFSKQ